MSARLGLPSLAGTAPDAAAALPIGSQIDAYTVLQVLSESRYGFVYLTRDDRLGTTRALKEFMPRSRLLRLSDGSVRPGDVSDSIATSVARMAFMSEGKALAAVQHPCLVQVLASIPAHRTLYRVMPLVDGVSLEQHCRSRVEPPTLAWVAGLVDNLLQAMQALHLRGLAHGCVQTQQVMIRDSGQALLLGFASVARELDNAAPSPWQSPTAPQRMRRAQPHQADDFPALAATAYFAATGLTVSTLQERSDGAVLDLRHALSCLPDGPGDTAQRRRGLVQALESALAPAEASQPQTVAEFRRLLSGEAPLRSVGTEPAPRWVGVMPQAPDEDVDGLTSQPTPLDEAGRTRQAATPFAAPVPAAAPLAAVTAAGTHTANSAPIASVGAPAALGIAPLGAVAATAPPVHATPPLSLSVATEPQAEPPAAAAPFDGVDPAWAERTRLAPRRQTRWPSRALAATVVLTAGVAAAWWYTSTPAYDRSALGPLTTSPAPIEPAAAAAIPVPEQPVQPSSVTALPATGAVTAPPASPAQIVATAPTPELTAPANSAALATSIPSAVRSVSPGRRTPAATAAQRSAIANPRTGNSATSRSSSTAPRPPAARSVSVAGAKPKARLRSPLAQCGNRNQFSLASCLQEQCARSQYRAHPQCTEVRNGG